MFQGAYLSFLCGFDASYLYLIDTGIKQIRGWRSEHGAWQKTPYMILLAQIKNELDLTEYSNQLPTGWKTMPPADARFGKHPDGSLRQAAWDRDRHWNLMKVPSGGFSAHAMGFRLPLVPLEMPYQEPVYFNEQRVVFLSREGIWLQTTPANWTNLICIGYDAVGERETKRLYKAWLQSM